MSKTRDNHYVPQWHQKGFFSERENELCHLKEKSIVLPATKSQEPISINPKKIAKESGLL